MRLKHLHNGASTPSGDDVGVDNGDDVGAETKMKLIIKILTDNPNIKQKQIADKAGLSTRTVSREIKNLRDSGVICRVGSDRLGYWEIKDL